MRDDVLLTLLQWLQSMTPTQYASDAALAGVVGRLDRNAVLLACWPRSDSLSTLLQ
jgi:hypothetical protein